MPCSPINIKAVSTHQNLMDLVEGYIKIKSSSYGRGLQSNVSSIKKVNPEQLPEKFEVEEIRIGETNNA